MQHIRLASKLGIATYQNALWKQNALKPSLIRPHYGSLSSGTLNGRTIHRAVFKRPITRHVVPNNSLTRTHAGIRYSSSLSTSGPLVCPTICVTEFGSEVQTYQTTDIPPGVRSGSQHVLIVGPGFREPKTPVEIQEIEDWVKQDGKEKPAIDSVVIRRTILEQGDVFSPFRNLRPRTLVLECVEYHGFSKEAEYNLDKLSSLEPHWPIEHLWVTEYFSWWLEAGHGHYLPSFGNTVTSLVLNNCTGALATTTPFKKLREVTILDGHACSLFVDLIVQCMGDDMSNASTIQIARLQNAYSDGDFKETMDHDQLSFIRVLSSLGSLEELELNTFLLLADCGHTWYDRHGVLPVAFPPNLKHLRFRGRICPSGKDIKPSLSPGAFQLWKKRAADPEWLPNLETFTFRLDHTGDQEELTGNKPPPRAIKVPEVAAILRRFQKSHPSVHIDKYWYKVTRPSD